MSLRWTLGLLAIAAASRRLGVVRRDQGRRAQGGGRRRGQEARRRRGEGRQRARARPGRRRDGGAREERREGLEPRRRPSRTPRTSRRSSARSRRSGSSRYVQKIEPAPADREQFGLGAKARTVRVTTGQGEPVQLSIGGTTPTGGGRYLALASDPNAVYVVDTAAATSLTPTLQQLRDKRLLRAPTGRRQRARREEGRRAGRARDARRGALAARRARVRRRRRREDRPHAGGALAWRARATGAPRTRSPRRTGWRSPSSSSPWSRRRGPSSSRSRAPTARPGSGARAIPVLLQVNPAVLTGVPTTSSTIARSAC